jgi:hypothetical protein
LYEELADPVPLVSFLQEGRTTKEKIRIENKSAPVFISSVPENKYHSWIGKVS